ncbi:MAG: M6 family metalloprotease domain-containing protein [Prevotella sp.]|nr:M6 family metalloprotease domain-containing protein [Bacteroides sp.]MCM1366798.1 M6 family metalloprotease domain-containing protein [Prevotella sp.]MCM1437472.1 M6 family metalloprotease domain-containing protein [Prevotella sp.]
MKLRNILPLAALAFPALLAARPANPNSVLTMTNPDGSVVRVINNGDERFNYYTLEDRETIVERNSKGFWVPVVRNGVKFKAINANNLVSLRAEANPFDFSPVQRPSTRMAPIDITEGRTKFPTIGDNVHSLVVLIEFADTKFSVPNPKEAFTKMLNEEGYSDYGSCGSARDYYIASSNGMFKPIFDVTDVIPVSKESAWYVGADTSLSGAGKTARFGAAIEEALKKLDEQGMDFTKYDCDEDGDIDNVFFFYAGYGQADSHNPTTIWPHQGDFDRYTTNYNGTLGLEPLYLDGKRVGPYACSNELNGTPPMGAQQPYLDGIGAFVHEFGHVLGLPDLYDTADGGTVTPGTNSVMDHASYNDYSTCPVLFSAYEKWVCHWLEFEDYDDNGHEITIPALSRENKAARLKIRKNQPGERFYDGEFYVLETRIKEGWDRTISDEGLMIWHIDYDYKVWRNNVVNTNGNKRVQLMPSTIARPVSYVWGTTPGTNYVEPSMQNALFANSAVFTQGIKKFGIYLSNINFDENKAETSLRYNLDKEVSEAAPVLNPPTRIIDAPVDRLFELTWSPVPGAEGYYVTCYVTTPSGTRAYLEGLNETWVGNKTYLRVSDYLNSYAGLNVTAYVRAKVTYPCSTTSNVQTFVPNQLEKTAGIDDIATDNVAIYGTIGEIVAPEGAEIYSINGVRTAKTDLSAGLYLVRYAGKTYKVIVK